jgi:hypothetical protein
VLSVQVAKEASETVQLVQALLSSQNPEMQVEAISVGPEYVQVAQEEILPVQSSQVLFVLTK